MGRGSLMRSEWQDLAPREALKIYCKSMFWSCRFRRQGRNYYVTVGAKGHTDTSNWVDRYTRIVSAFFPQARMTSGSADRATFSLGTVFDMIQQADK